MRLFYHNKTNAWFSLVFFIVIIVFSAVYITSSMHSKYITLQTIHLLIKITVRKKTNKLNVQHKMAIIYFMISSNWRFIQAPPIFYLLDG